MKKVIVTRILAAAFVVLGMLLGLLPPFLQIARADTFTDYPANNSGKTATDLHYTFDKKFTREQVRAYIPFSTATVSKSGKTLTLTGGEVKDGEVAGITVEFEGEVGKVVRKWWTFNGLAPEAWGQDKHIQEAEGLLPLALKATKNEKLREGLQALGRTPLSDFDTLTAQDTPTQIEKLAKLAKDTGDPAADFLAKAAAIVAKVIVKAGVSEVATASPDPGKTAGPVSPQPAPAPSATHNGVEPGKGQTGRGPSISARDRDIGDLIADVMAKAGKDGVITVEESRVVRYEPVLGNNLKGATTRPTLSTISVASFRPGRGVISGRGSIQIWGPDWPEKHFRICNEWESTQEVVLQIGTNVRDSIPPGECREAWGSDISVSGMEDGEEATVTWDTVG